MVLLPFRGAEAEPGEAKVSDALRRTKQLDLIMIIIMIVITMTTDAPQKTNISTRHSSAERGARLLGTRPTRHLGHVCASSPFPLSQSHVASYSCRDKIWVALLV